METVIVANNTDKPAKLHEIERVDQPPIVTACRQAVCRLFLRLPIHESQRIGGRMIDYVNTHKKFKFPVKANIVSNTGSGATYPGTTYVVKGHTKQQQYILINVATMREEVYDKYWTEKHFDFA